MKHTFAYVTLALTISFVVSPALTDPFSGFRADQLPIPQIDPPVQPAGYAFAIWGLIYAWLLVSALFGVWKRADDAGWTAARLPLIASLAIGTPWLAVANTSAIWATVMIFAMAVTAIAALMRSPAYDRWWLRTPVAIYAGWLTAASFVSLGSTAAGYGLVTDALGWAYLGIALAAGSAGYVLWRTGSVAYGATVIWALIAVIVANGAELIGVSSAATAGIVVISALIARNGITAQPVPS
ncbi:hypothetical protein [Yoonia sp. SS1-5]|uniref:Seryl-tRNA synthetase n=1 Tax=Yoonia rhodophyticola TaxID=3137370 RepID=A0AAN0MAC6_9RHOB